jgi:hypothetical protein
LNIVYKRQGLLLHEVQILGPDYTHILKDDFTIHKVNKFIFSIKNNKATGYESIPAEVWVMIFTEHEGTEVSTKLFCMIRNI